MLRNTRRKSLHLPPQNIRLRSSWPKITRLAVQYQGNVLGTVAMNRPLHVLQYNVNRSKDRVMAQFLRDPAVLEADLIFVQEPWENPYQDTTHHPANGSHQLLYPDSTEIGDERARVCLYISRQIDPNTWKHTVHSKDVQELKLTDADGQQVRIFNIYNRPDEVDSTTLDLVTSLTTPAGPTNSSTNPRLLLLGDFNLHHPAWEGERSKRDSSSDQLLELIDTRYLDLWLEPGTTTWERNGSKTTIDLVLGSQDLTPRLVTCEINERNHADSDHYPIRTLLDISTKTPEAQRRRNWKACSVKDLQSFVDLNLQSKAFPLQTKQHIELAMEYLIETINQGIAASTPWAKPSKWANPSFNAECREMVKITRKFRREYTESVIANGPTDPTTGLRWERYTKVRNRKGKVLAKALRQGHRSWVRKATESGPRGMWKSAKWARSREARGGLIPTLKTDGGLAETAEQKVEAFRKAFFPEPPPADLSDIPTARIPPQIDFPDLTEHEVLRCIRRAPPDKAPGPDGIPNKVWHWLGEVSSFLAALTQIFNACLRLGHNPEYFQQSTTVVLRKAAPRDYRIAKSYRPIALLNTLGKILEAVATVRIAWALEERNLLPRSHLGGRRGISVDHLIQLLLDQIFENWGKGRKVSMLLLDVAGAFDNVSHIRLLHNLRMIGLDFFAGWLKSFLSNRSTRLQLPGYLSNLISTPTGIPQGSPISPILFLLFNTPLIRALSIDGIEALRIQPPLLEGGKTVSYGWIDDVATLAISDSYAVNQRLLERALDKAAVWSRQHSSKFAPDKFELIHFKNPLRPDPAVERPVPQEYIYTEPWQGEDPEVDNWDPPMEPPGHDQLPIKDHATGSIIKPVEYAKYLGIWFDRTLSFDTHRAKALAKANRTLEALRSISGSTWGTSLLSMRRIYLAVRIQTRAAILISSAFRNTASAALEVELYLPPIRIQMQQTIQEAAIRIQTGPAIACPRGLRWERSKEAFKASGYSPMEALKWKKTGPLYGYGSRQEVWETRRAHVLAPWESPLRCIIEGAEEAVQTHDRICREDRQIWYTDGNGYQGMIGAAAVSIRADRAKPIPITVFSDSQAAIQAVRNPGRPSGQYALRAIYERIRTLRSEGLE
ncbi:putative RNA-directed DNA polymerase from transposon X-element, partial [Aspergillus affinis]|uniref:putative RNA-directed DNA polymerase from transposon X-element n=1 Tax=Aspergillus affinis TaxID=1070780 RepID=UPI0022FF3B40